MVMMTYFRMDVKTILVNPILGNRENPLTSILIALGIEFAVLSTRKY
jgi:hypothetical protein